MTSRATNKFSPEVRARAVRMAAVLSIAAKIGCAGQTLYEWVKKAEVDSGMRAGVPRDVADRMKALERENRELRQANEILRKASAYFAMAERRKGGAEKKWIARPSRCWLLRLLVNTTCCRLLVISKGIWP